MITLSPFDINMSEKSNRKALQDSDHPVNTHAAEFPRSLGFPKPKVAAFTINRDRHRIQSIHPSHTPNSGNNKIQFRIPKTHIIDFRKGVFSFEITITPAGGPATFTRLSFGAYSFIKKFSILDPKILEENRAYNKYAAIVYETTSKQGDVLLTGPTTGAVSAAERTIFSLVANKRYSIGILSGILNASPFPAKFLEGGDIMIEFELAPPSDCLETNGPVGSANYTVTNCELEYDWIDDPDYERFVVRAVNSGGLNFSSLGAEFYQSNPITAANQNINITHRSPSVEGIILTMKPAAFDGNIQSIDKFLTWQKGNIQTVQIRNGGRLWPQEEFDAIKTFDLWIEYQRMLHKHSFTGSVPGVATTITLSDFETDRFLIYLDLNGVSGDGLINPIGTSGNNIDMILLLKQTAPPAVVMILDYFVLHWNTVLLKADGKMHRTA